MKKVLAQVAFTMALGAPAFAWANGPGALGTFGPDGGAFSDSSMTSGAFLDSYTFDLNAGQGTWYISSLSSGNYGISNFGIELLQGGTPVAGTFTSMTDTVPGTPLTVTTWTEVFNNLKSGLYTLDFSGTFGKTGGAYGGSFTVVPAVPEPSTWIAMLVGLGLMLTVARKRQFHL